MSRRRMPAPARGGRFIAAMRGAFDVTAAEELPEYCWKFGAFQIGKIRTFR